MDVSELGRYIARGENILITTSTNIKKDKVSTWLKVESKSGVHREDKQTSVRSDMLYATIQALHQQMLLTILKRKKEG